MEMIQKPSLIYSLLCAFALTACGGGGDEKPNTAPSIVVNPSQIELESTETKSITINATDDDGAPTLLLKDVPSSVKAELSSDGKSIAITANTVSAPETVLFSLVATEISATKLQTTAQISVKVYPKLELSALINNSDRVRSMTVEYAKPLQLRIVDDANQDIPFSSVAAKDPSLLTVQTSGSLVTLTSLKGGETSLDVLGTLPSGHKYARTLSVKTIGNQQPTLSVLPKSLSVEEYASTELTPEITDPDRSYFQSNNMTVSSSDPAIATAAVKDGTVTINGIKIGMTTVTITIVDGEFTVTETVSVTVNPETPPTISLNNDQHIELEEQNSISIPIDITGSRASEYTTSISVVAVSGNVKDVSYVKNGNVLTITAGKPDFGSTEIVHFDITATATNGRNTVTSRAIPLNVLKRTNASPIFEFANKFGSNVMIKRDGTSEIVIQVNDDNPKNVTLFTPEPWFNNSKAGTYTVSYDDATRTIKLTLTGFERNERFGIFLSYKDSTLGGKFGITFRTYDLSAADLEVIEARKDAIAKIEAIRAYQLIARMYAEHLENLGLVDAQYIDEMGDQLKVDDVPNFRYTTAESYINIALEQVYSGDYNNGNATVEGIKEGLNSLMIEAQDLNKTAITQINEMAAKSNGLFPSLEFEKTINPVSSLHYSKFFGKAAYGSSSSGTWEYSPTYKFLSAIDAKVKENTDQRSK